MITTPGITYRMFQALASKKINILVICTGNSCRSQMAEGYLKYFSKQLNINSNVYSAGIRAEGINKKAIVIMAKDGMDISNHTSNSFCLLYTSDAADE